MPNHVANEIRIECRNQHDIEKIKELVLNADGEVDFELLLPIPLNVWRGNVGLRHEKAFPDNALDWCRRNWGTKWGPYGGPDCSAQDDSVVITFQTAWSPPRGWVVALWNKIGLPMTHTWMVEDETLGVERYHVVDHWVEEEWTQHDGTEEDRKRMSMILFGVESTEEEI